MRGAADHRVSLWAIARPFVVVRGLVRHMRPLVTLCLLWHRARPARVTLARPPAPRCLSVAAHRPVPTLWRPTVSQTVPPSEHTRRGHEPTGSLTAMRSLEYQKDKKLKRLKKKKNRQSSCCR